MPNWCSNVVSFEGDPSDVLKAVQALATMLYDPDSGKAPQIPDFLEPQQVNIIEFGMGPKDVPFHKPWSQAIELVRSVAEHSKLSVMMQFALLLLNKTEFLLSSYHRG